MKILLITATLLFLAPQQVLPVSTYAFRGVVLDANGQKVAGASVEAASRERSEPGRPHQGKSQEDGSVIIDGLAPGKYRFYVWKVSAGVPYTPGLIYQRAEDHYPELAVGPETADASPVELHLPAPYGAMTVRIRDAAEDAVVLTARIRLEVVGQPQLWLETSTEPDGKILIQLPERATSMKITAPGYETWTYPGYLVLQGGTSQSIEVKMKRK